MNAKSWNSLVILVGLLSAAIFASLAIGQGGSAPAASEQTSEDQIPPAALLTEQGRQLADRLRHLRRSEASLGLKHPSRKSVQAEIAAVKEELNAWSPDAKLAVPEMNDKDLHQLLRRMSIKIELLEYRVEKLEKQLEVF